VERTGSIVQSWGDPTLTWHPIVPSIEDRFMGWMALDSNGNIKEREED
jgi:hypothetical protein